MRIFLRPLFSMAATKFLSSHEFMEERSMGSRPGNTARSCGHMFPLKDFVSTVVKTTGTSNTLAAFPNATLLLMIPWRPKLLLAAISCEGFDNTVRVVTEFRALPHRASLSSPRRPLGDL